MRHMNSLIFENQKQIAKSVTSQTVTVSGNRYDQLIKALAKPRLR